VVSVPTAIFIKKIRGSSNKVFSKGPRLIRDYPQLTVTGAAGPATTGE